MKNEVGSHLGAIFGQGGAQVGKKGPGIGLKIAKMGAFRESISQKKRFFQALFSDAFLGGIFNGFGRFLGIILMLLGGQMERKTEKAET